MIQSSSEDGDVVPRNKEYLVKEKRTAIPSGKTVSGFHMQQLRDAWLSQLHRMEVRAQRVSPRGLTVF